MSHTHRSCSKDSEGLLWACLPNTVQIRGPEGGDRASLFVCLSCFSAPPGRDGRSPRRGQFPGALGTLAAELQQNTPSPSTSVSLDFHLCTVGRCLAVLAFLIAESAQHAALGCGTAGALGSWAPGWALRQAHFHAGNPGLPHLHQGTAWDKSPAVLTPAQDLPSATVSPETSENF